VESRPGRRALTSTTLGAGGCSACVIVTVMVPVAILPVVAPAAPSPCPVRLALAEPLVSPRPLPAASAIAPSGLESPAGVMTWPSTRNNTQPLKQVVVRFPKCEQTYTLCLAGLHSPWKLERQMWARQVSRTSVLLCLADAQATAERVTHTH
jgi:hypothetical protein